MRISVLACLIVVSFSRALVAQDLSDDLLLQEPTTPAGHLDAALLMVGLERPDLAREHMRAVLTAGLSPSEVRDLTRQTGLAVFLRMARDRALRPESRDLLKLVNTAAATDPSSAELEALVADLNTEGDTGASAALELERFGAQSVPALLKSTDSSSDKLLISSAHIFQDGLIAALPASDEMTRIRILRALSVTGDRDVADFVLRDAFSAASSPGVSDAARLAIERLTSGETQLTTPEAATRFLVLKSRHLLNLADDQAITARTGHLTGPSMVEDAFTGIQSITNHGMAEVTDLDPASGSISVVRLPRFEATLIHARRLAQDALAILPDDSSAKAVERAITLSQTLSPLNWEAVPDPLPNATPAELADVAMVGLETSSAAAAFGALRLLETEVVGTPPQAVILKGMNDSDPRIRLQSALLATSPLADSTPTTFSPAVGVLHSMSQLTDAPLAVLIDQNRSRGGRMGVFMSDLGYYCRPSNTGIAGFDKAIEAGDCAAILVNAACIRWSLSPTVANFRSAPQTSSTPILVYGEEFQREAVESLAARYNGVSFVLESFSSEAFAARIHNLDLPAPRLTPEERVAMRQVAVERLEGLFPAAAATEE